MATYFRTSYPSGSSVLASRKIQNLPFLVYLEFFVFFVIMTSITSLNNDQLRKTVPKSNSTGGLYSTCLDRQVTKKFEKKITKQRLRCVLANKKFPRRELKKTTTKFYEDFAELFRFEIAPSCEGENPKCPCPLFMHIPLYHGQ